MPFPQHVFTFDHAEDYSRENFLTAPSNKEALDWIERWPRWPASTLVLFGPEGSGKTHLGEIWRRKSGADLVKAADLADPSLYDKPLVIDHVEQVAGHAEREEMLFHLYNKLRAAAQTLLLIARGPVAAWHIALPDLRSRLLASLAVEVKAPDDELLAKLLQKLFADRQLTLGGDVVAYLLPRMERSFAGARLLVDRMDKMALATKRPLTIALAKAVLAASEPT